MRRTRRILIDGRTRVNYTVFAPVHARMRADTRVRFEFIASEEPRKGRSIFRDAGADATVVGPLRAAITRYDAYLTSDFMWTHHVVKPLRIQMFHGVGGKYGFDAPTESLRTWHRLFFVNRRRLTNCVKSGALDPDSPAVRLIGMPKVDCLVDGSLERTTVLNSLGLDPGRKTVLYAPTWSPASSLNRFGLDLIRLLSAVDVNVIVKLHDRSGDVRPQYSGGVDWAGAIRKLIDPGRVILAQSSDVCPYLVGADLLVTDHSSCGFEYLLLDRPLVRIHVPELIALANIHPDYVSLLAASSESVEELSDVVPAVERGLEQPSAQSASRRSVAADLFYQPGTATERCVTALYEAVELEPQPMCIQATSHSPGRVTTPLPTLFTSKQ
jgi:hypothetical protein